MTSESETQKELIDHPLEIRFAQEKDLPAILLLAESLEQVLEQYGKKPVPKRRLNTLYKQRLYTPLAEDVTGDEKLRYVLLVASAGEKVHGFLLGKMPTYSASPSMRKKYAFIQGVSVVQDSQHSGVGHSLEDYFIKLAKARGAYELQAEVYPQSPGEAFLSPQDGWTRVVTRRGKIHDTIRLRKKI